jgi:hypothetical protein
MNFNLNTLLAGGVGGVAFFAVWAYLVVRWVLGGDFAGGLPFGWF